MLLVSVSASWAENTYYYIVKNGTETNDNIKYLTNGFTSATTTTTLTAFFNGDNTDNPQPVLSSGDIIYIAKGTYTLTATLNIDKTLNIYGGFSGEETWTGKISDENLKTRNIADNATTLTMATNTEESVIHCNNDSGEGNATLIDGFTIQNGKGNTFNDGTYNFSFGGGVCILDASPTIQNCTFKNNTAGLGGAVCVAAQNAETLAKIINCLFDQNTASGATYNENDSSGGGAIVVFSNNTISKAEITNCTFTDNKSTQYGGAISVCSYAGTSNVADIKCCTFKDNTATTDTTEGGGIYNSGHTIKLTNCTLVNTSVKVTDNGTNKTVNCIDNPTSTLTPSTENIKGVQHTFFTIENNPTTLAECVYAGEAINFTTDQLGRTFHTSNPSIGAVELSADIKITTATLPDAVVGKDYNGTITATCTAAEGTTFTWTTSESTLPTELTIDTTVTGNTLTIKGKPTTTGTFSVKVKVACFGDNITDEKTFTLTIKAASSTPVNPDPENPGSSDPTDQPQENPGSSDPTDQPQENPGNSDPTDQPQENPENSDPTDQPQENPGNSEPTNQPQENPGNSNPTEQNPTNQEPEKPGNYEPTDQNPETPDTPAPDAIKAPEITTRTLPSTPVNDSYSALVSATGSTPMTWLVTGLPNGLDYTDSIGSNTLITGQALETGEFNVTITVSNNAGSDTAALTLTVTGESDRNTAITTSELPAGLGQNVLVHP